MRILRFHKLKSVSVFVIVQVPYVNLELKWQLFRSDSIVTFFFFFEFVHLSTRLNVGHHFELFFY